MLRSFVSICITLISGLLVFAVLRPTQASYIYNQLRTVSHDTKTGVIQSTVTSTDVLGESEQPIVSKSGLLSFFDKKYSSTSQSSGNLAIQSVIDATNNERVKAKLLPFEVNSKLAASAKIKVEDMITRQYFEHEAPTGEGIAELGKKVGYNYIIIGENLALGNFASADDLLLAWMNSPGHRANILNDKYQELGIYVAEGLYKDKKVWFAVQHGAGYILFSRSSREKRGDPLPLGNGGR